MTDHALSTKADTAHPEHTSNRDAATAAMLQAQPPTPPDRRSLVAYSSWLAMERRYLCHEMYPELGHAADSFVVGSNAGFDFHTADRPSSTSRAEAVLSLIGCDWSHDGYLGIGDDGPARPQSEHFPHPDARLMDLEREFLATRATLAEAASAHKAALASFDRQEEEFVEVERDLIMHPPARPTWPAQCWSAEGVRRLLMGGSYGGSRIDFERCAQMSENALRAILPRLEAREGRQAALSAALDLDQLLDADDAAYSAAGQAAERIYRHPAHTLEGLAIKRRTLKIDRPELWSRPDPWTKVPTEWHEIALTEIAEGVQHLMTVRGVPGGAAVHDDGQPAGMFAELTAISGGVFHDEGIVCFTDAAGKVLYKPVADWMAHTAMRMWHRARTEMARQLNDPAVGDNERERLEAKLRLDLRVDALHALAFRHREAFDLAQAEREALVIADLPVPKHYRVEDVSPDLQAAIEAHREAAQLAIHDPVEDDARTDANCARVRTLGAAIRAIPARSLADLRYRMVYSWPGAINEVADDEARETLERFHEDVIALAGVGVCTEIVPTPLPAPGSDEAKAAFKAACHQHTLRTQFANGYSELKRTPLEWWTASSLGKALETGELTPAECARFYPLATERELRMAEIEHELNLGGLFALAFADEYAGKTAALPRPLGFQDASINQLARFHDHVQSMAFIASTACNAPMAWGGWASRLELHRKASRSGTHPPGRTRRPYCSRDRHSRACLR